MSVSVCLSSDCVALYVCLCVCVSVCLCQCLCQCLVTQSIFSNMPTVHFTCLAVEYSNSSQSSKYSAITEDDGGRGQKRTTEAEGGRLG